jgi:hypothetical protein
MSGDGRDGLGEIPWLGKSSVQMDAKRALFIGALGCQSYLFLVFVLLQLVGGSPYEVICYTQVLNASGQQCSVSIHFISFSLPYAFLLYCDWKMDVAHFEADITHNSSLFSR